MFEAYIINGMTKNSGFPVKLGTQRMEKTQSNQSSNKQKATLEIFLGVFLLGTGPMFVKFVRANGTLVAFYRLLFAAGMLAIPVFLTRKKYSPPRGGKPQSGWLIAGGLAFAVNITLWSSALNHTSAAIVTVLDNTAPMWVGIFTWIVLRQRMGRNYWIGLSLALAGAALLAGGDSGMDFKSGPYGIFLSVLSGVSYAAYILITQKARGYYSSITYSWMVTVVGAVALFIFGMMTGVLTSTLSARGFTLIFLMALSSQVVGWYLVNHALGQLPPGAGAVALVGQPVVTTILGIFILGEMLSGQQWLGAVLCLAGILAAQRRTRSA